MPPVSSKERIVAEFSRMYDYAADLMANSSLSMDDRHQLMVEAFGPGGCSYPEGVWCLIAMFYSDLMEAERDIPEVR
jgi:hypothetical protein